MIAAVLLILLSSDGGASAEPGETGMQEYAAREAAIQTKLDDDKTMRVLWSAIACYFAQSRGVALKEIEAERSYSRRVGVANLAKLEELKGMLRQSEEHGQRAIEFLKGIGAKPIACSSKEMKAISFCIAKHANGEEVDDCSAAAGMMAVVERADLLLRGR